MRGLALIALLALVGCDATTAGGTAPAGGGGGGGVPATDQGFTVQDGCLKDVIEGQVIPIVDERGRKICE